MVPGFLQMWRLSLRPKSWILVPSDQIILCPLGALRQTPSGLSCAFYCGVASVWQFYNKGPIGGVIQRWLSFWKVLPSPQRISGALSEWQSGSWSPHRPRPFSPDCAVWREASSRKSLGVCKLLPFKNDGGHCVLGDIQCCIHVLVPFPRSVPQNNPVSEFYGQFLPPHGWVVALTCTVNCGTLYRQVCASSNHVQSIEFTTGGLQSSSFFFALMEYCVDWWGKRLI
jgi:hypothetical protein